MSQENQNDQSNTTITDAMIKERIFGQLFELVIFFVPGALVGWLGMLAFDSEEGGEVFCRYLCDSICYYTNKVGAGTFTNYRSIFFQYSSV